MGNTLPWSIIRWVQRLSMLLTVICCIYVVVFLIFKIHDNSLTTNAMTDTIQNAPAPAPLVLDMKANDIPSNAPARDIFSLAQDAAPTGNVDSTPKGQLPSHLKVVGIVVGHPSQIIIEDSSANKTYFIDENTPQGDIKIVKVSKKLMIINYQGQDIPVPISKE